MITLTQSEILDELVKLGITSTADLMIFCKEYTHYYNHEYIKLSA